MNMMYRLCIDDLFVFDARFASSAFERIFDPDNIRQACKWRCFVVVLRVLI